MYTPRTVACKTVIVTEEEVCPIPVVAYPDTPEIWFDGSMAHCTIMVDCGGQLIDMTKSTIELYNGEGWVSYPNPVTQLDPSKSVQTVDLQWEMKAPTTQCVCMAAIWNDCGQTPGWVSTNYYEYTEGVANITATSIIITPSACEAPCNVTLTITWKNTGDESGIFIPNYSTNGVDSTYTAPTVTLHPGASYTMADTLSFSLAGSYVICPVPN